MRKVLEVGGILAAIVLIAFGIGAIITGVNGKNTVSDNLTQERIVGSPDMTPDEIKREHNIDASLKSAELAMDQLEKSKTNISSTPIKQKVT